MERFLEKGDTTRDMFSMTVVLAAVLFNDALKPLTLLGGCLILAAVILLTRGELRKTR